MKKRILTMLIAVMIVVGVFVVSTPTAQAATSQTLSGNQSTMTISTDTVLDLNGYNITTLTVNQGVTVTLKDSQTDDYDATNGRGYGKITTITGKGTVLAENGYLLVNETGKGTSSHKLTLKVSGVVLRATDLETDGASLYYQATFGGDTVIESQIKSYGVALGAGKQPDFRDGTFTSKTDLTAWENGKTFTYNSTLLKGIMRNGNAFTINKRNSLIEIFGQAYIELADGTRITGTSVQLSLKDVVAGTDTVQGVEQQMGSLGTDAKNAAKNLYNTFTTIVETWGVPQIRQAVTGGAYQIKKAADMKVLSDKPDGDIILANNINMSGMDWTPVSVFSGTFDGNGKTISNLSIDVNGTTNYVGMFNQLTADGAVTDLNLENFTLDASGSGARFVGTFVGLNYGTIENCTVTGTVIHDNAGSASSYVFMGVLAGRSYEGSVTKGGTSLSVVDKVTDVNGKTVTYTTEGLCAKLNFNVPDSENVMRRIVGNFSSGGTYSGDWQDLSFGTENDCALIQNRRQAAVQEMFDMGTFKWTVPNLNGTSQDPDLIHYGTTDEAKKESHIHTQKFYNGTVYYGIPYDHTSSSLEQVMHYMEEGSNGVYILGSQAANSGNTTWGEVVKDSFNNSVTNGFTQYIGNDCSGAVAWAWHHAAPRYVVKGGVYVLLSGNMLPNDAAEETYGIYRVGSYTVTDEMVNDDGNMSTYVVATENGTGVIYEAYARTKMGDGLLAGEPGGHVRMAAKDSVVIRNKNGAIYADKSYILTHEQGDGLYDRATTNSSWRINYKYTFKELFEGKSRSSGKGYLPITIKAFIDDTVPMAYSAPYEYLPNGETKILTPAQGQVNAGNRILSTTVVVKDSSGKVVYEKTAFKGENGLYNAYRSNYLSMVMKYYFSDYVDYVQSGKTYTFSVDCTVAGGTLNADGTISNTTTNVIKDRSFTAA